MDPNTLWADEKRYASDGGTGRELRSLRYSCILEGQLPSASDVIEVAVARQRVDRPVTCCDHLTCGGALKRPSVRDRAGGDFPDVFAGGKDDPFAIVDSV